MKQVDCSESSDYNYSHCETDAYDDENSVALFFLWGERRLPPIALIIEGWPGLRIYSCGTCIIARLKWLHLWIVLVSTLIPCWCRHAHKYLRLP